MQTSIFIARLLGPVFLAIGLAVLANRPAFRALGKEVLRSHALIYLFGTLDLVGGLALVLVHNVWVLDWRVLITLLGWIGIVRGLVRIFFPQRIMKFGTRMLRSQGVFVYGAIVTLAIGAVLSYFGYAA